MNGHTIVEFQTSHAIYACLQHELYAIRKQFSRMKLTRRNIATMHAACDDAERRWERDFGPLQVSFYFLGHMLIGDIRRGHWEHLK